MEPAGSTQWQPSNEFSAAASLCARRLRDASMAARSRQKEIVRRLARARRVYTMTSITTWPIVFVQRATETIL